MLQWSGSPFDRRVGTVSGLLIGVGVLLILLTFGLAFTIFGELSAVLGLAFIALGAFWLGRRSQDRGPGRSGRHRKPGT
jgi:hypothetical protein